MRATFAMRCNASPDTETKGECHLEFESILRNALQLALTDSAFVSLVDMARQGTKLPPASASRGTEMQASRHRSNGMLPSVRIWWILRRHGRRTGARYLGRRAGELGMNSRTSQPCIADESTNVMRPVAFVYGFKLVLESPDNIYANSRKRSQNERTSDETRSAMICLSRS